MCYRGRSMNLILPPLTDPRIPDWICDSYAHWSGELMLPPGADRERALYHFSDVVVAHGTEADPLFFYGNRAALALFEMSWDAFTRLPSRLSAEPLLREEREAMLEEVRQHGISKTYTGTRISASGKRFRIEKARVWNLLDAEGRLRGQAARFPVPNPSAA